MLRRITGLTLLAALLAAPFVLMTPPAQAGVREDRICYTGRVHGRLGILIEVDDYNLRELLLRSGVASEFYGETFRQYRGFDVCIPLFRRESK